MKQREGVCCQPVGSSDQSDQQSHTLREFHQKLVRCRAGEWPAGRIHSQGSLVLQVWLDGKFASQAFGDRWQLEEVKPFKL